MVSTGRGVQVILVVRHCGLGDLLTALPAMRGIRRRYPQDRVVTTCPRSLVSLASRLCFADGYLTESSSLSVDPTHHLTVDDHIIDRVLALASRPKVVVALRVPVRSDLMHGLTNKGAQTLIAYRHAGVQETAGFDDFSFDDHISVRWERLLQPHGITTDCDDLYVSAEAGAAERRAEATVIHVGAASPARRWPTERWAEVVAELATTGHRVVLSGSQAERPIAETIAQVAGLPAGRNLCGETNILELSTIVRKARLVVSTDTGILHLATAFRTRSVTLFGAVSPAQWGPPADYGLNASLWTGGFGDPYSNEPDRNLLRIPVKDVLEAVVRIDTDHAHLSDQPEHAAEGVSA